MATFLQWRQGVRGASLINSCVLGENDCFARECGETGVGYFWKDHVFSIWYQWTVIPEAGFKHCHAIAFRPTFLGLVEVSVQGCSSLVLTCVVRATEMVLEVWSHMHLFS